MLFRSRVTDLVLPLDHPELALRDAVLKRLGAHVDELRSLHVFRRGYDARKKSSMRAGRSVSVTPCYRFMMWARAVCRMHFPS